MKKRQILLIIFILICSMLFGEDKKGVSLDRKEKVFKLSSLYSDSYALVIGISQYNEWPKLKNASHDAEELSKLLSANGFRTTLINDSSKIKPTKANILNALSDLKKIGENSRILIYFSGHGQSEEIPYKKGYYKGYIVPHDAKKKSENDNISMEVIKDITIMCKAKHILYFFDSCFSGHFVDVSTRSAQQNFKIIESKTMNPVRMAISAGTANQEVSDGNFHSPMADSLISMLTSNEGDYNDDGFISGEEAAFYIKQKVESETFGSQTPESGKMQGFKEGDFILRQVKENSSPLFISDRDIVISEGLNKGEKTTLKSDTIKEPDYTLKSKPFSISAGIAFNSVPELSLTGKNADKFNLNGNSKMSFFISNSLKDFSVVIDTSFDFKNITFSAGYNYPLPLTQSIFFSPGTYISTSFSNTEFSTKETAIVDLHNYPVGSKVQVSYNSLSLSISGKLGFVLSDSTSIVTELEYPLYQTILDEKVKINADSYSDFIKIDELSLNLKSNISCSLSLCYNF